MLSRKRFISHIRVGLAVAVGFFLVTIAILFLLASDDVIAMVQTRIPLIFMRLVLGIALYAVLASFTIRYLDKLEFHRDSWKRWTTELMVLLLSVAIISLVESRFEMPHPEGMSFDLRNRPTGIALVNSAIGVLMFMVYEIWTVIEANQQLQVSLAVSEKDRITLQLASLQQKLNPHFLFNSLNVLSELMYEDKEKANEFIHQFSKVYRYVLDVNEKSFVLVDEEMKFLESYSYLQKIRFGEKLQIEVNIDSEILDTYVPPLAFQLLLENAIKHNEISELKPLKFTISYNAGSIIVKNSLNLKASKKNSTGIGQKNLISTYSLLSEVKPIFTRESSTYIVKLPILKKAP